MENCCLASFLRYATFLQMSTMQVDVLAFGDQEIATAIMEPSGRQKGGGAIFLLLIAMAPVRSTPRTSMKAILGSSDE